MSERTEAQQEYDAAWSDRQRAIAAMDRAEEIATELDCTNAILAQFMERMTVVIENSARLADHVGTLQSRVSSLEGAIQHERARTNLQVRELVAAIRLLKEVLQG